MTRVMMIYSLSRVNRTAVVCVSAVGLPLPVTVTV